MAIEVKNRKVMYAKVGGRNSDTSYTPRIAIPTRWFEDMGLDPNNRDVLMVYNNDTKIITIKAADPKFINSGSDWPERQFYADFDIKSGNLIIKRGPNDS